MREPAFWWRDGGLASGLLAPLGLVYGAIAARRMIRNGARCSVPVLCVGNFTLGGAGKTPTVMALSAILKEVGERPYCLSRGYGGSVSRPKLVDAQTDGAPDVGDEALLLARETPTIVARDRVAGAKAAAAAGASVIVMDDGLQNGAIAKNFTIAVIDARRGIGNGCVFPAGPLRAPLDAQIARTDALLVIGDGESAAGVTASAPHLKVFHGRLVPDLTATGSLKTRKVLAFAGIGDPEKFYWTVEQAGIDLAQRRSFADHHRYSAEEAAELIMDAEHDGLALLTTEKDRARMAGDPALAALAAKAHVLPVTLVIDEADELRRMLLAILLSFREGPQGRTPNP